MTGCKRDGTNGNGPPRRKQALAEGYRGRRDGITTAERDRIKALERENRQLRQANEILKKAPAYFAQAELDRPFRK